MSLNPRMTQWHGRTVWLVGASTGIGRATASALHAQGAQVVVSARSVAPLEAFVSAHPGARALPLDVTEALAVKAATQVLAEQGALDCVVYCAGHYHAMDAMHIDLPDMLRQRQVQNPPIFSPASRTSDLLVPTGTPHKLQINQKIS